MKGTHHLNATLIINNVVNLSFVGDESDIILCNGCSIIWTKSSKLFWTSLNLIFNVTNEIANNSAIHFENAEVVTFSNASFSKFFFELNFYSRTILVMGSSIIFESCKFKNGYHSSGGSLYVEDSNVTFGGHNVFLNNAAKYAAGAIYGLRSQIQFNGSGTFMRNRVGIDYGRNCNATAIHVEFSNISLNGYFKFHNNQATISFTCFDLGGTVGAVVSSLTMQGVFYFINNSNCNGGAIMLRDSECLMSGYFEFEGNEALLDGGAIWLHNSECLISGQVEFEGNKALSNGGAISVRHGSLNINSSDFYFYNNSEYIENFSTLNPHGIVFCNNSASNWGGGVELYSSNMTLTGYVIFMENEARRGGGIAIYYNSDIQVCNPSFITFREPLELHFCSNVAKEYGGALNIYDMYSDCKRLVNNTSFNCFFTVTGSINFINVNFTGNKASDGVGIYGGAIQYCQVKVKNEIQRGYQVLQNLIKTSIKVKKEYSSRDSYKICHCNCCIVDKIKVQRGVEFNISVIVLGEFDLPVNQSVEYYYNDQENSSEVCSQPNNNVFIKGCRTLRCRVFSRRQTEDLILHPNYQCFHHPVSLTVTIYLEDCPPGFVLIKNACNCQENIHQVTGHEDLCNSSTGLIKCPQHDWMKPILYENQTYEGFMWSPNCPAHLCRNDKDKWLNFSSDNVDCLCLEYHTKMLCGACLQNYSLTLSSLKCSKCKNNNYLSLLLVFTLAGVALIASLLLLHMTVADGTINGLILYANIFDIIDDIVVPQNKIPPYPPTVFLSWLNLDFGIPTCFYTGLNYYSYTWLQFVFPFYLWFLVGLIILACKYSSRAMKLFGSNPVAVLATVVLMSYNKLLHTSQQILSYVTVYYSDGTQEKRWKIDPNLLYFQGKHIPLALFGILIVAVFLIPYIVLLTFGHYLQKYSNKRGLKWLIKIKPILDAYYAPCYKSTQYWVGFLLFTRTCLSITYSALSNKEHITILVIVSSVLTGVALIPWLHHKVYEKNFVNVFEGSFILNIIVLSFTSYHIITQKLTNSQLILSHTFIGIAFIEFLLILSFHAWHRLNLKWLYMRYCKNTSAEVLSSSIQCVAKVKDIDKTGENASTSMVFSIREPLLDDSTEL